MFQKCWPKDVSGRVAARRNSLLASLGFRSAKRNLPRTLVGSFAGRSAFDKKLSFAFGVVILCTGLLAAINVVPTFRNYQFARQTLEDIRHFRLILDTGDRLAEERGPANDAMSMGSTANIVSRLAEFRARSDVALAKLEEPHAPALSLHHHNVPSTLVLRVQQQLVLARTHVDTVSYRSLPERTRREFQTAINDMFVVSDQYRAIIEWRANRLIEHDLELIALAIVGEMLNDLRDYGGRIASLTIPSLATGGQLPLDDVVAARRIEGHLREVWSMLNWEAGLFSSPALVRARRDVDQYFFGEGLVLIDHLIRESEQQTQFSLTSSQLTERYSLVLRYVGIYRSALLDAAVAHYVEARDQALWILVATILSAACALIILMGSLWAIRKNLFAPLMQLHDEVLLLAGNGAPVPQVTSARTSSGEVDRMLQAIRILKAKLKERAALTSQLHVLATTDSLTALLNRRALDQYACTPFDDEIDKGMICLVLMDIDHFKAINDSYGHPTGDRVLIQIAELLRANLREQDVVARYGGEEFAILIVGDSLPGAVAIARKLRLAMQREWFSASDGRRFKVTASFGVARGQRGLEHWLALVELADAALYRAKSDGRNRVRLARNIVVPKISSGSVG